MMGMKLVFVAALSASCAIFLTHSAPTSLTSGKDADIASSAVVAAEKPLIRTKRAEEILYGNHQNAPRVKKSDPAIATSEDAISPKNDDVVKDDAKTTNTDLDDKEKIPVDSEQSLPTDEQEEIPPKNEPLQNVEDIPSELNDADYQRYEDQEGSEDAEALRKKRSIKTVLMTAENMADSSSSSRSSRSSLVSRPVRAKRDLDYEHLRQLFANSREGPYEQEELEASVGPDGRYYVMEPEQVDEGEEEEENGDVEDEEKRSGGVVGPRVPLSVALRPYDYEPSYEQPSENEELLRELVERKVEEDAREKLLDYLLAAAIASEAESANEAEMDASDDEGIIEDGPGRPDYEDESLRDVIGAEPQVALKRNDFYPYSYEPYGGRWGAMVPGSKRNANEYDRLYRLAEALNADNDYDEE